MSNFKAVVIALGYFGITMLFLGFILGNRTLFIIALISLGTVAIARLSKLQPITGLSTHPTNIVANHSTRRIIVHDKNNGLIFLGIILSIIGFIFIFTTFFSNIHYSFTLIQGPYGSSYTLLEGSNACNSWIGGLGSAISEDFLTSCRTISMAFYLSVISLTLGIVFIIIGLIKRN